MLIAKQNAYCLIPYHFSAIPIYPISPRVRLFPIDTDRKKNRSVEFKFLNPKLAMFESGSGAQLLTLSFWEHQKKKKKIVNKF